MKNKNTLVAILLLSGALLAFYLYSIKEDEEDNSENAFPIFKTDGCQDDQSIQCVFNPMVMKVQAYLNYVTNNDLPNIQVNGYFGNNTEDRLEEYLENYVGYDNANYLGYTGDALNYITLGFYNEILNENSSILPNGFARLINFNNEINNIDIDTTSFPIVENIACEYSEYNVQGCVYDPRVELVQQYLNYSLTTEDKENIGGVLIDGYFNSQTAYNIAYYLQNYILDDSLNNYMLLGYVEATIPDYITQQFYNEIINRDGQILSNGFAIMLDL